MMIWDNLRSFEREYSRSFDDNPPYVKITEISQFVFPGFPSELPSEFHFGWTYHPFIPLVGVIFYLISQPIFTYLCNKLLGPTRSSKPTPNSIQNFIFFHNFLLFSFSAWIWFRSWSLAITSYLRIGFLSTYCSELSLNEFMRDGYSFYMTLFYLSKYYEFIDTYILIVKGKSVSLLQIYHHSGAVIAMYLNAVSQSPGGQFFVGLNSMIHTIMYAYFASVSYESWRNEGGFLSGIKKYITSMQIGQFFIGIALTFYGTELNQNCYTDAARFAVRFSQIYVVPLIVLFAHFYVKSYSKKKNKKLDGNGKEN